MLATFTILLLQPIAHAQILWLIAASATLATSILASLRNGDASTLGSRRPAIGRGRGILRCARLGRQWGATAGRHRLPSRGLIEDRCYTCLAAGADALLCGQRSPQAAPSQVRLRFLSCAPKAPTHSERERKSRREGP